MEQFESFPVSIVENATTPKVMLNASNDHQLFFKAYNDYSDLDEDGDLETTYSHEIDYYGYFDSYKCYTYDSTDERFEPEIVTTDKYCTVGDDLWSGNFLNWASMARIDTIRKILFGGHRRVDTATETVLERTYLPHDAHSWAKYYNGDDIPQLTPFSPGDYNCDEGDLTLAACQDGGSYDEKKAGITIGNTTDVNASNYTDTYSEGYTEPPLIKVVKGNYSLWASNERWQITWASGAPFDNHDKSNGNDPDKSGIYAYPSSPAYNMGLGEKNYVARVVACDDGTDANGVSLIGEERCKKYPGSDGVSGTADDNYKPIGMLQIYGDNEDMEFGMVAGSYDRHASGGDVVREMGNMLNEINVGTDGTFPLVAEFAGGPTSNSDAEGMINAWSLYRIIGYDGSDGEGLYNQSDNCPWAKSEFSYVTDDENCRNWGNPFSEIYYQSIKYLANGEAIDRYKSDTLSNIPGLPLPKTITENPISADEYCAQLSVVNLNSSVFSYDADELDDSSYGPSTIWDPDVLPGDKSTTAMTNYVGGVQNLHNNDFFFGELDVTDQTDDDNQLCTDKTLTSFGEAGGLCPEAPRLQGSYRIAGLAYYAHTQDIRPAANNNLEGLQTVDTYSVALATSLPVLEIPDPNDSDQVIATIIPACRNTYFTPYGNCAIVDYKVIAQDDISGTGKVFVVWEDSEQGGDYDQDMWGIIEYQIDSSGGPQTITVTTDVVRKSTPHYMGFGYVISGTADDDGFHTHSGINGYVNTDTATTGDDCSVENVCQFDDDPTSREYTLGTSTATLLKDPLWYAAKYGGFTDSDGNNLPNLQEEWDSKNNDTWESGSDGVPDNYFLANNPQKLETAMDRVFGAILERTSSGTAAAVVSSNVRGEGAIFQAYYEPMKRDGEKEATWIGTLQSLWLDSYGLTRQDCSPPADTNVYDPANDESCPSTPLSCGAPNGQLDDYCVDNVVETYFDDYAGRTRVRVFASDNPLIFQPFYLQGVVDTFTSGTGALVMMPNSMEGVAVFNSSESKIALSPFSLTGTLTAYDETTGVATLEVTSGDWTGVDGDSYTGWQASSTVGAATYYTDDTIAMAENSSLSVTLSPINPALSDGVTNGDTVTLITKNIIGQSGDTFNDWIVECTSGNSAVGEVEGFPVTLSNKDSESFTVVSSDDFTGCSSVKISTYDMQGSEGDSYSNWYVTNLDTVLGTGSSSTSLPLSNIGSKSLNVDPTVAWLEPGNRVSLSNYSYTTRELYDVSYLWNGRKKLSALSESDLYTNRLFSDNAGSTGRYITTWIDDDLDGMIDSGEYRDFDSTMLDAVNYNFFDTATQTEAEETINYVRGIEVAGTRSRTIKYSSSDTAEEVMRLGDIIDSTPTVVGSPQEGFDLLYDDESFKAFRHKYQDRRVVVYVGGNDGLLHAFNGGFYNAIEINGKKTVEYSESGLKSDGTTAATEHDLGSELWAYAPMNLLPHLRWLKDDAYARSHVYFVNSKPRVFDANIFTSSDMHPNGWGTIMVVGMSLGGGILEVDADTNQDGVVDGNDDDKQLQSAYLVFDITDPEVAPVLLAELPLPDNSFSTVYPAVHAFRDVSGTNCNSGTEACNTWYLTFGTGPDDIDHYDSSQNASVYLFDLKQLTTISGPLPDINATVVPTGCSVTQYFATNYNIIACDTGISESFIGTPMVVDWDLDFYADASYYGIIGDELSNTGGVLRFDHNNDIEPGNWDAITTFFDAGRPVNGQPVPALDDQDNKWIYFGTGRYFTSTDKINAEQHTLYGIKEEGGTVTSGDLLDVTDIEVYSDGTLGSTYTDPLLDAAAGITTFEELEDEIDRPRHDSGGNLNNDIYGWKLYLPQISGSSITDPSTRNTTRSSLLGGVLFTTVFQPDEDPCKGEGLSRLYGSYYKTGTAYPGPAVLGSSIKVDTNSGEIKYLSNRYLDLGIGVATAPALHSGSGSGSGSVKVFNQLSTGDITQSEADTVFKVRAGKTSWSDQ